MSNDPITAEAALDKAILENQRLRLVNITLRFALFNARHKMRFMAEQYSQFRGMAIKGAFPIPGRRFLDGVTETDIEKASGL